MSTHFISPMLISTYVTLVFNVLRNSIEQVFFQKQLFYLLKAEVIYHSKHENKQKHMM